tara:strand:- start:12225 stop:13397 length:1173 start_codon:yes stop_codon:yes gene_type:complete
MAREFDIIIFGATGYTGKLIAEYLVNRYGAETKMAIAGRSESKLNAVRETLDHPVPVLVGDSEDLDAMRAIAGRAKLIVSCTGPFILYGSNMVQACAELGTHYVDVTGEVYWSSLMMAEHGETAKNSGARIISCCGFDSVPSDLGVYLLQKRAKEQRGKAFDRIKMRIHSLHGGPLGGSQATQKAHAKLARTDPEIMTFITNPFGLCPDFEGVPQTSGREPAYEEEFDSWAVPFLMHDINSKIVHRTNLLLGLPYGDSFVYDEMQLTGPGEEGKLKIEETVRTSNGFNPEGITGEIKPGVGPDKAMQEAGYYSISYYGIEDGRIAARIDISDDRDPGGGSTCKLVGESAMCLLQDDVTVGGGFWTPASAMGDQLAKRLLANDTIRITQQI